MNGNFANNTDLLKDIFKLYNIKCLINISKIKTNIKAIVKDIQIINKTSRVYKIYHILDHQLQDIREHVVHTSSRVYNIQKIKEQKLMKNLVNTQINLFTTEYYFKKKIDTSSKLYGIIINDMANIAVSSKYVFIITEKNTVPIGIKYIDKETTITLHQLNYFGKRLEQFLTDEPPLLLYDHERLTLFTTTSLFTFPTIFTVYEARNHIIKEKHNLSHTDYLKEIVNYVTKKGYFVTIHRHNNTYTMSLSH